LKNKYNIKTLSIKLCYPVENTFINTIKDITVIRTDINKYPHCFFFFNNGICLMKYNTINNSVWLNYNDFMFNFDYNNSINYRNIVNIIKPILVKYFNLNNEIYVKYGGCTKMKDVENYFKLKIYSNG